MGFFFLYFSIFFYSGGAIESARHLAGDGGLHVLQESNKCAYLFKGITSTTYSIYAMAIVLYHLNHKYLCMVT